MQDILLLCLAADVLGAVAASSHQQKYLFSILSAFADAEAVADADADAVAEWDYLFLRRGFPEKKFFL